MGASSSRLSAPFYLTLASSNPAFNGTALEVCTTQGGGNRTALCALGAVANSSTSVFEFEKISTAADESPYATGFLKYFPSGSDPLQFDFRYDPISNVAFANFVSLNNVTQGGLYVAFFDQRFEISTNYIDSHPTQENLFHAYPYFRWQICNNTFYSGQFTSSSPRPTLNWQLGQYQAQNPTCESVEVHQQFV